MDQYIGAELNKRYKEHKMDPNSVRDISVINLVLQSYLSEPYKFLLLPAKLDFRVSFDYYPENSSIYFHRTLLNWSSIRYAFFLLSKYPVALARLRTEHDEVLGPDLAAAASKISGNSRPINNLPCTLAVINKTLCLYPPASASGGRVNSVHVVDDTGCACLAHDSILWVPYGGLHQSEKYCVRGSEPLPERRMVSTGHELYPRPDTWRPFEAGVYGAVHFSGILDENI